MAHSLEQTAEYEQVFDLFDRDGTGHVALDDFATILRSLTANPTEAELNHIIVEFDLAKKGHVDFTDFLRIMARNRPEVVTGGELGRFREFEDPPGCGFLTRDALFQAVNREMELEEEELSEGEIVEMCREIEPSVEGDTPLLMMTEEALAAILGTAVRSLWVERPGSVRIPQPIHVVEVAHATH